jgi:hypothetical protein
LVLEDFYRNCEIGEQLLPELQYQTPMPL